MMTLEGKVKLFAVEQHSFYILPEFDETDRRIKERDPVFFTSRDLAEKFRILLANSLTSNDYKKNGEETFAFATYYFHNLRISARIEKKEHMLSLGGKLYYSDLSANRIYEVHETPYEPKDI